MQSSTRYGTQFPDFADSQQEPTARSKDARLLLCLRSAGTRRFGDITQCPAA